MDQKGSALSLKLSGALEEMDARTIAKALECLHKLVHDFLPPGTPVKMAVLEQGSAVLGVCIPEHVTRSLSQGIYQLENERTLPKGWTVRQAGYVKDLAKLVQHEGVTRVELVDNKQDIVNELTPNLVEGIEKALKKIPYSLGSVRGELYAYAATAAGLSAKLRGSSHHGTIRIEFSEDFDDLVRSSLRKTIDVYGLLQRNPSSNRIETISVRSIEIVEKPQGRLRGRGLWREYLPEGVSSVEIVRKMRDEDSQAEVTNAREA